MLLRMEPTALLSVMMKVLSLSRSEVTNLLSVSSNTLCRYLNSLHNSISNGKVIWAKNLEIQSSNLKAINMADEENLKDGEKMNVQVKELGVSDIFPQSVKHSPNGHTFVICSDDEYSIFRSQNFKNVGKYLHHRTLY